MRPKERVLTAMRHEEPDRVPLFYRDIPEVDVRLQNDLGLKSREELFQYFDIDFRWAGPKYVGPALENPATGVQRDIWGVEFKYVPASYGGYWEPVSSPLMGQTDPAVLDDYPWPQLDWFDFSVLDAELETYRDYAIMTAPGPASPGPLATIQWLLGMEGALSEMLLHPKFYEALIDRIVEFDMALMTRIAEVAGDRIDFYRLGDDFGTQQSLLISPRVFSTFFQPFMRSISDLAKQHGGYYYHHTCGAIRRLIPAFIETGMDVLDPVQVGATGMTPAELKAEFGDQICFSGGVDEQDLLPNGTPEQVREAVFKLLDDMARGGGFFIGPTHNLQADIPTENIVAMYDAAREWTY